MHEPGNTPDMALLDYLTRHHAHRDLNGDTCFSFHDFMAAALYHPTLGYYNTHTQKLGAKGDFITAAELTPLYAYCFTESCITLFRHLSHHHILELGAGTGQFAADLLHALNQQGQLPDRYFIYDISPTLRERQRLLIQQQCPHFYDRIEWLDHLPPHFTGLIIANEVLDAQPVHCFEITATGILERCVKWDGQQWAWQNAYPSHPQLTATVEALQMRYDLTAGYQSEINLMLPGFLAQLARILTQGVILFADYGYGQRDYYHPHRKEGTITGYYQHQRKSNPLQQPGLQDLTAHVDFTRVAEIAIELGFTLTGFTSQAGFLLACGLTEWTKQLSSDFNDREHCELNQKIKTLTLPHEMGERCKIMALSKNGLFDLPGFTLQDKRREL